MDKILRQMRVTRSIQFLFLTSAASHGYICDGERESLIVSSYARLRLSRVDLHYTQSGSSWSRAICHYVCHPPGRSAGQKIHQSDDLSCARQRVMKGVSLFIRFGQPCELWAVYIDTWFVYREKFDVSWREFRKVSFHLRKHTYANSLRGHVALHCPAFRDRIDILSLFLSWMIVQATLSFVWVILAIPSRSWMITRDKIIEILSH